MSALISTSTPSEDRDELRLDVEWARALAKRLLDPNVELDEIDRRRVADTLDRLVRGLLAPRAEVAGANAEAKRADQRPIPLILTCPSCSARHVDAGDFATKPHHTHACQACGLPWRPAIVPTVGVQFLPGFKDAPAAIETPPAPSPVCTSCNDTHTRFIGEWGPVVCAHCPLPCEKCCRAKPGDTPSAYCVSTPCSCECHRKAVGK